MGNENSHLANGDINDDADPRALGSLPKYSSEARRAETGTNGEASSKNPAYTHAFAEEAKALSSRVRVPQRRRRDDRLEHSAGSLARPRTPPRLSRTFQRDQDSSFRFPHQERRYERDRSPHSSPRYGRSRDYDDDRGSWRQTSERDGRRSPPRRQGYDSYDGRQRSFSPRNGDRRSPPPRRQEDDPYDDRRRSLSPDRRRPASPSRSRPSLSSPFRHTSYERRPSERPLYSNLSWTAPKSGTQKQRPSHSSVDLGSAQMSTSPGPLPNPHPERVNFNGLQAVPRGPKGGTKPPHLPKGPSLPKAAPLPRVADSVRSAPHIHIPPEALPPLPATVQHLAGFCGSRKPDAIHVDDSGYYLTFPDTPEGHDRLQQLCRNRDEAILFSQYTIKMQVFHNGQTPARKPSGTVRAPDEVLSPVSAKDGLQGISSSAKGTVTNAARGAVDNIHLSRLALLHEADAEKHTNGEIQAQMSSPMQPRHLVPSLRSSSPLRVPSRQDVDDASSVSGKTTSSDMSGSKRTKCHVCKQAPALDVDALVHCSTCPRRYHKRCHASPAVPSDADRLEVWQCQRCIKKQVRPKARSSEIGARRYQDLPGMAEAEQPPAKRSRFSEHEGATGELVSSSGDAPDVSTDGNDPINNNLVAKLPSVASAAEKMTEQMKISDDALPAKHPASGDSFLDEADKLVESSFAASDSVKATTEVRKPIKLNLTRRKVPQPEQNKQAASSDSHATGERDEAASHSAFEARKPPPKSTTNPRNMMSSLADSAASGRGARVAPESEASTAPSNISKGSGSTRDEARSQSQSKADAASTRPSSSSPVDSAAQKQPIKATAIRTKVKKVVMKCSECKKPVLVEDKDLRPMCVKCKQAKSNARKSESAKSSPMFPVAMPRETGTESEACDPAIRPAAASVLPSEIASHKTAGRAANPREERIRLTGLEQVDEVGTTQEALGKGGQSDEVLDDPLDFWSGKKQVDGASEISRAGDALEPEGQTGELQVDARAAPAPANNVAASESDWLSTPPPSPPSHTTVTELQASRRTGVISPVRQLAGQSNTPSGSQNSGGGKRKRRDRIGGTGFGDSHERPSGTYEILIKFALCDAPNGRLQSRGVCHWIANNIPNYKLGEDRGRWEAGIGTTLSAHVGRKNKKLFNFSDFQKGDDDRFGTGGWYTLQSGLAEKLPRWDPVLKQPVSPPPPWASQEQKDVDEDDSDEGEVSKPRRAAKLAADKRKMRASGAAKSPTTKAQAEFSVPPTPDKPRQRLSLTLSKRSVSSASTPKALTSLSSLSAKSSATSVSDVPATCKLSAGTLVEAAGARSGEDMAVAEHDQVSAGAESRNGPNGRTRHQRKTEMSSDEEPLANVRRALSKQQLVPAAAMRPSAANDDLMDLDPKPEASSSPEKSTMTSSSGANEPVAKMHRRMPKPKALRIQPVETEGVPLAQLIKLEADQVDYSAKSLFEEWPEYDPSNQLDTLAKVEEIRKRPSRKQMFGKPAMYSRLGGQETTKQSEHDFVSAKGSALSFDRSNRSPQKVSYFGLPALEENVEQVDTLEEFFALPANPLPLIKDGKLVYRDGTRDAHGKLPRASVYYPTGYS